MNISLQIRSLRKQQGLTQEEFALKLGVNAKTIGYWESGKNLPNKSNLIQICDTFNLSSNYFEENVRNLGLSSDTISIDYYPDVLASCGPGGFEMSQEVIKYDVPATLFQPSKDVKSYSMCHAKGNSMYPRIWDGDFLICEHKDNMKIENGEMYIFCFDDQIYLKRLTKNINQIVVESENPDFPTQYIEKDQMNDVHLIGHVICSGRMNGKYLDKRI